MKQAEFIKICVSLNLKLAEKSMKENDYNMAMYRMQDARRLLNTLRITMIPVDRIIDYDRD